MKISDFAIQKPITTVMITLSVLVLDTVYDGWYSYYVFQLPRQHPIVPKMLLGFWIQDIMVPLFVAFTLSLLFIILAWRSGERRQAVFYAALLAGCLGAAWVSRVHEGGYANVLLPAYATLALLFGIAPGIASITVLQAAMAPMITAAILAQQHDLEPELSGVTLGLGILLSFLTVPLISALV